MEDDLADVGAYALLRALYIILSTLQSRVVHPLGVPLLIERTFLKDCLTRPLPCLALPCAISVHLRIMAAFACIQIRRIERGSMIYIYIYIFIYLFIYVSIYIWIDV